MKHVTIKDIALHLGLSVSTVSRALSDDRYIKDETKRLVAATAEKMGYRRNNSAALLRTGRTGVIGLIVNEQFTPYASNVLSGIQPIMQEAQFRIQIANSFDDAAQERLNLQLMEHSLVDGLIVEPCSVLANISEFRRLMASGVPIVFLGRSISDLEISKVVTNNYESACAMTRHFLETGKKKIVHVTGSVGISSYAEIERGFIDTMEKAGFPIKPEMIIKTEPVVNGGQEAMERLLASGIEFDAVFACNDILALGAMNRLRRHGLRIPEDVAVTGFSGSMYSALSYPPLTTVKHPVRDMGKEVALLLLEHINNPSMKPRTVVLNAVLELRESSGFFPTNS